MIYIIVDSSHECDDICNDIQIVFVGTSKEKAVEVFEKMYSNPTPDDKWCYVYDLYEYEDGYFYYDNFKTPEPIRHSDNIMCYDERRKNQ